MIYITLLFVVIAYLFGSVSSAIIVCKLMGLPDPRSEGSHNPGATNVLRIGGKKAAAITLLGDVLKGIIPVLIAKWFGLNDLGLSLVAFAAFLGHLYPLFFGFIGGKGVATALGCFFILNWQTAIAWIATWAIITALTRYVSIASMIATVLAPLYIGYFTQSWSYVITLTLMAIILVYRHRSNITNLAAGKEKKIDEN